MSYTPIQYIQSTGTQYIDTGFYPSTKTKVDVVLTNELNSAKYLFGARNYYLSNDYSLNYDYEYVFNFKGSSGVATGIQRTDIDRIIMEIPSITINDVVTSGTAPEDYTCDYTMYLFAINNSGSAYKNASISLHYMKIWDDGTLVFDLIPVLDENNVACLYNKVTGTYLYNAGTGDFVAGDPIAAPIITIGTPSRKKISSVNGYDQATVTFQSDMALQSWEARATLNGITPAHGVGLLVESGGSIEANTDATVYVDDEELTNGDQEYTISIFGLSTEGRWSDG